MEKKPSVVMVGLGYIGLPTAALIASRGLHVTGVDVHQHVVDTINKGQIHIVEPDLDGLVHHVVHKSFLKATLTPETADVYLIAVPTPFKDNYVPDVSYVLAAVSKITPTLEKGALVILESTSPVGTTRLIEKQIYKDRPELEGHIFIAYCPERVLPGNILYELKHNDRAIGGINKISTQKAIDFYKYFVVGTLHPTNAKTAEMVKLVENASRDNQIAFANELSIICDKAGINVWDMIALANKHPRVNILNPGTGVGGHCIAVDPWFIVSEFPEESGLIKKSRETNNYKTQWVLEKIKNKALGFKVENSRDAVIACMGLAFKPDIDDLRESPALLVAQSLKEASFTTLNVEPNLHESHAIEITDTAHAIKSADIIVFLVSHSGFKSLELPEDKIILDFCGVLN
ncbi:UDP-N-acetyl-D-mannosamine dehydrogenase [Flavobacteriaceae bacterium]|nr:UDP-N-acetyl-D-mannosamine dehydrogenase [Ulvibacter sp.]MDB4114366.1 UDP-N-acetyl-D-mannosamine dehydrogenase [Flavobacteriaceae bacterium]MDC0097228.1 UDP-N-acetyl-D-mannosamine dehydrogenase [Flavobacteriaceae bacterium]MDC1372821.1 UDP-N-acetyl-D-mannosamine dehydrogenase [Flavobacteriaceae bacterium]